MVDRNLTDFYGRLYRIQKIRRRGGGFEAAGTLGRAYFVPRPRRRGLPILGPLLIVIVAVTCLKGVIFNAVGPGVYDARIASLQKSASTMDEIGGLIMQAGPATHYIANKIASLHH